MKALEQHRKLCEIRTIYHCRKCGLRELIKKQTKRSVSYTLTTPIIELGLKKEETQNRLVDTLILLI